MGELADIAKENSPFIKLNDGESITAVYKGFKKSSYKGTLTIEYSLGDKILTSSSGKFMILMDDVEIGKTVLIARKGLGVDTAYEVDIVVTEEFHKEEKEEQFEE